MNIQQLLKPISRDQPCGPDVFMEFGYGFTLDKIVDDIVGSGGASAVVAEKVNTQSADWGSLVTRVTGFFGETKHIQLAYFATLASLKISGFSGLLDGVVLYKKLLVDYWDSVYPQIEGEDFDDRLYEISKLDDHLLIESLMETIVVKGKRPEDAYSISQLISSQKKGEPKQDFVNAAINEMLREQADVFDTQISVLLEIERELLFLSETYINEKLPGESISLGNLQKAVVLAKSTIEQIMNTQVGEEKAISDNSEALSQEGGLQVKQTSSSNEIVSRDDAKLALDKIIRFYSKYEPTSPVPGLLKRAKRMVNMDFMQIVKELGLDQNRFESGQVFGDSDENNTNN